MRQVSLPFIIQAIYITIKGETQKSLPVNYGNPLRWFDILMLQAYIPPMFILKQTIPNEARIRQKWSSWGSIRRQAG